MSKEFIESYANQKKRLKQYFEREKTGDQTLYTDQAKLLEPLINSQKETQNKIVTGQETISNAIVPFIKELQKRNDQVEALQSLPFYNIPEIEGVPQSTPKKDEGIPQSTPKKDEDINVNLDVGLLNETHRENLDLMKLELPSVVLKKGNFDETFKIIDSKYKSQSQFLADTTHAGKKATPAEKEMYKSQRETLLLYKNKIEGLKGAKQFIVSKKTGEGLHKHKLVKQKRGRGRPKIKPDLIVYNNPDDLAIKLKEYILAKEAGNTGLDNYINEMLDELLEKKCINKDGYDSIFKNIFGKSK